VVIVPGGTITQVAPVSGTTPAGTAKTDHLAVTGSSGTLTFVTVTGTAFTVSSLGVVSATDTLAVGTYTVSGTDSDTFGNTGNWTYTLTVTAAGGIITQGTPTSGTTSAGTTKTDHLAVTGSSGTLTFVTVTVTGTAFTVSASGVVSAPNTLAVGTYTVSGTDSDTFGNIGTWTYTLTASVGRPGRSSP
jgi:hypothetical protein